MNSHPQESKQDDFAHRTTIILVTGFLGSGKTTVMKNLIRHPNLSAGLKIGVIINEFGRINVDARLFEEPGLSVTEINNGSIFCKCLEGTFIDHIVFLKEKQLDYLFVEASGLADPSNMMSIMNHVERRGGGAFVFGGTICVTDAKYYLKLSASLATLQRQVAAASMVMVNKTDLSDDRTLEEVIRSIHHINPFAHVHPTSFGRLPDELFTLLDTQAAILDMPSLNTPAGRPDVLLLQSDALLTESFIPSFLERFGSVVLRLKGFIRYQDGTRHVDSVGSEYTQRRTDLIRETSELVVIPYPGIALREEVMAYLKNHAGWECEVI